jgi:arylsulfatase
MARDKSTRLISPVKYLALLAGLAAIFGVQAKAQAKKPNILVIFGDDIGQANISRYTHGLVGYMTPNIDRVVQRA